MTGREKIDYDMEKRPIEIKDSKFTRFYLKFFTAQNDFAGGVRIKLSSTPQYRLVWCNDWTNFPKPLPYDTEKIWRITLDKSEGIRVKIYCNGVLMLNLLLTDHTCADDLDWSTFWSRDVDKIYLPSVDYYRPYGGD